MNQSYLKKIKYLLLNGFMFILAIAVIQACDDDDDDDNGTPTNGNGAGNIVEVAQSNDDLSQLADALEDVGLDSALEDEGPFTVFAPTNEAFANLSADLSNEELEEVLSYHVVESNIASGDLESEQSVEALSGGELFVTADENVVINDTATVTSADIEASNGVIHSIDVVLLPDSYQNVAGIISKRYSLQTLEDAVVDADLDSTLEGDGPYTVFAPTNEAFENVDLSGLSQEELQNVLTYHVLPQEVLSGDIESGTVETVNGETIDIEVDGEGNVSLTDQAGNTSSVTTADLQGTNGVVHIIDGVLSLSE